MMLKEGRVLIRTEKLCKACMLGSEQKAVIKDADIRIMQGEYIVAEGLRGAQRKVFFNLFGCIEPPTSGKYYFDYEDIALADERLLNSIRKLKLGYLFRNFKLVPYMTAAENIEIPMYGLAISQTEKRERLLESMKSLGIEELADKAAVGLTDYQKQLVALARAVINKPLMILADEPAANLDEYEEQLLMEQLARLNEAGTTIMLITERLEAVKNKNSRVLSYDGQTLVLQGGWLDEER
jgi:putative ABC transport system ATP-binding protein